MLRLALAACCMPALVACSAFCQEEGEAPSPALFYYNGSRRVALEDSGKAVAKVRASARVQDVARRPEAVPAAEVARFGNLSSSLERMGMVMVRTRGERKMSPRVAERPAEVEFVLPVLRELRPRELEGKERTPPPATLVLTPQISARFTDGFFADAADAAARRGKVERYVRDFGLEIATPPDKPLRVPATYALRLAAGDVATSRLIGAANRLFEQGSAAGAVVYAKPNFLRPKVLFQAPPVLDPRFPNQWHLRNTGTQGLGALAGADANVVPAWSITLGVPSTRIAILDDSVQREHPDLKPNYQTGRHYDASTGGFDDDPSARKGDQKHGTSCAGVAVAAANDVGVRGAAPGCGLIGVHIWDSNFDLQTADAFYFAADPDGDPSTDDGAAVISCSWGLNPFVEVPIEVATAIDDVVRTGRHGRGAVVLFAAGNDGQDIATFQKLGARPSVICVGATNYRDVRAFYSNFGPELSVVAPSNDPDAFIDDPSVPVTTRALAIDTTDNTDDQPREPNEDRSGYAVGDYTGTGQDGFGGTSSATPLAAGVCGLILSVNPGLSALQVRSILEHTCDRVQGFPDFSDLAGQYDPSTGHSPYYGHGRINAGRAVERARAALSVSGLVWSAPAVELRADASSGDRIRLEWKNASPDLAGVLVVRGGSPVAWRPHDGERYVPGDVVDDLGTVVVSIDRRERVELAADPAGASHFAVYPFSREFQYAWGRTLAVAAPPPPPAPPAPPQ